MPQMAPIGWLSLFIMFTFSFLVFCMMNYYTFFPLTPQTTKTSSKNLMNSLNWKW